MKENLRTPGSQGFIVLILTLTAVVMMIVAAPVLARGSLSLYATSPTTISIGGTVGFMVEVGLDEISSTGEYPVDPPPDLPFTGSLWLSAGGTFGHLENVSAHIMTVPRIWPDSGLLWQEFNVYGEGSHQLAFDVTFQSPGIYEVSLLAEIFVNYHDFSYHYFADYRCIDDFYCWTEGIYAETYDSWGSWVYPFQTYPSLEITVVPEPAAGAMLAAGMLLIVVAARRCQI